MLHPSYWRNFAVPMSCVSTESLGLVSFVESVPTCTRTTSAAQEERWVERREPWMHSGLPRGGDRHRTNKLSISVDPASFPQREQCLQRWMACLEHAIEDTFANSHQQRTIQPLGGVQQAYHQNNRAWSWPHGTQLELFRALPRNIDPEVSYLHTATYRKESGIYDSIKCKESLSLLNPIWARWAPNLVQAEHTHSTLSPIITSTYLHRVSYKRISRTSSVKPPRLSFEICSTSRGWRIRKLRKSLSGEGGARSIAVWKGRKVGGYRQINSVLHLSLEPLLWSIQYTPYRSESIFRHSRKRFLSHPSASYR